ncbi:MAG: hypothetical protein ACPGVB_01910 [Chitinophagales bacterium]
MAIWQYKFFVIPKEIFDGVIHKVLFNEFDLFEDDIYWTQFPIKADFFSKINNFLPLGKSWTKDLIIYGNLETNCFEVLCENDYVISVSFRIDFTSFYEDILRLIIEFLEKNNLLIISEEFDIVSNNYIQIKAIIENSIQYLKYNELTD